MGSVTGGWSRLVGEAQILRVGYHDDSESEGGMEGSNQMADMQADPRFQGRFAREVTPEEYDAVRSTWLKHVGAEEKLFVPHSEEEEEERQLKLVRSTMTDDCVYELKNTGERWEGWEGAKQLYKIFLSAFSGMQWVPQAVVIGPQGNPRCGGHDRYAGETLRGFGRGR